jgi:hypothetical protein
MPTNEKRAAPEAEEFAVFQAYIDLINSERETLWDATMRFCWPIR